MHDVSLHLLDLLENSVRAGAHVVATTVVVDESGDLLTLTVEDDGHGLPVEPAQALDPFYTTKQGKKTGLGLAMLREAAEAAGGALEIGPSSLGGVRVRATMVLSHVDRPPLGDIGSTIDVMAATNPGIEFRVDVRDGATRSWQREPGALDKAGVTPAAEAPPTDQPRGVRPQRPVQR